MPSVLSLPDALRDMKRYFEILSVLIKHGFGDIVQELKLESLLEKGLNLVGIKDSQAFEHLPRAVRLRRVLEELGTTFIKLGQILSTRPDLVPAEWVSEFKQLQDNCSAISFELIEQRLNAEFPETLKKIFRSIDPIPLATASIAQIHRAVFKKGKPTLLKIVRPGIEELIEADIGILRTLANLTEQHFSNLGWSPTDIVDEFDREIHREIDLQHEARATQRFRAMFANDPAIVFPRVYWEGTTQFVMAQQEIKGKLLSQIKPSDLSIEDRRTIVANGARAVFRQCLEVGFFHADPHPGNLIALPKGHVAFIDCGMVGQIDKDTRHQLAQLVNGVVTGNIEQVIRVVAVLTDATLEQTEARTFRADVQEFVTHFEHTPLGQLNMGALLQEFFEKLRAHNLRCPADLVLLIKALTTIESVGKDLDPDFDMVAFSEPYIQELVQQSYGIAAVKKRVQQSLVDYAELIERLPSGLSQILRQLQRNKMAVNLEHRGLGRLTTTIEHASRNVSFALIVAAMLVGSSILVLADSTRESSGLSSIGVIGFSIACILMITRVITNRRHKG